MKRWNPKAACAGTRRARLRRICSAGVGACCITAGAASRSVCEQAGGRGGARQASPVFCFTAVCHRRRLTAARRGFVPRCASSAPEGARRDARERAAPPRGSVARPLRTSVVSLWQPYPSFSICDSSSMLFTSPPLAACSVSQNLWGTAAGQFGARLPAEPAGSSCASWRAHQRCTALPTTADRRPECCGGGAWREQHSDRHS